MDGWTAGWLDGREGGGMDVCVYMGVGDVRKFVPPSSAVTLYSRPNSLSRDIPSPSDADFFGTSIVSHPPTS